MQLFSFFARPPKRKLAKRMVFSSPWAVLPNSTQLLLIFKFSFITFGRDDQWFSILLWLQKKSFKVLERNLTRNDWCTSKQSKSWEKIVKKKKSFRSYRHLHRTFEYLDLLGWFLQPLKKMTF